MPVEEKPAIVSFLDPREDRHVTTLRGDVNPFARRVLDTARVLLGYREGGRGGVWREKKTGDFPGESLGRRG